MTAVESNGGLPRRSSRLWWWVLAAFAVQAAAWTAWFVVAAHNQVQEVPLVQVK